MKNYFSAGLLGLFLFWASPAQAQVSDQKIITLCNAIIAKCPNPSADDGEGCSTSTGDDGYLISCITANETRKMVHFGAPGAGVSYKIISGVVYKEFVFLFEEEEKTFLLGILAKIPEFQHLASLLD